MISIKNECHFIEIELWYECSPLNLLHILRTSLPKNKWRVASVNLDINFEKCEKIRLDHDEILLSRTFLL